MTKQEPFVNRGFGWSKLREIDDACFVAVRDLDPLFKWPSKFAYVQSRPTATLTIDSAFTLTDLAGTVNDAIVKLDALRAALAAQAATLEIQTARLDTENGDLAPYVRHLDAFNPSMHHIGFFWPGTADLSEDAKREANVSRTSLKDGLWLWKIYCTYTETGHPIEDFVIHRKSYMAALFEEHKTMDYDNHVPPKLAEGDRFGHMLSIAYFLKTGAILKSAKSKKRNGDEANNVIDTKKTHVELK